MTSDKPLPINHWEAEAFAAAKRADAAEDRAEKAEAQIAQLDTALYQLGTVLRARTERLESEKAVAEAQRDRLAEWFRYLRANNQNMTFREVGDLAVKALADIEKEFRRPSRKAEAQRRKAEKDQAQKAGRVEWFHRRFGLPMDSTGAAKIETRLAGRVTVTAEGDGFGIEIPSGLNHSQIEGIVAALGLIGVVDDRPEKPKGER